MKTFRSVFRIYLLHRPLHLHTFWQYLKRFGTAEKKVKTMSLQHAWWRYLKRFGTVGNEMKTMTVNGAFGRNLKRFGNAEKILKTSTLINECIMTLYETVVETANWEKQLMFWLNQSRSEVGQPSLVNAKLRTVIVAFWRYLIRYFDLQRFF